MKVNKDLLVDLQKCIIICWYLKQDSDEFMSIIIHINFVLCIGDKSFKFI